MRASVFTLGCKVNQYESQAIITKLQQLGLSTTEGLLPADIFVLNTCSVTAKADKKSRQAVARILKINKNAKIIILGCSAQNDAKVYFQKPGVVAVFGTANKLENVENTVINLLENGQSNKSADVFASNHHDFNLTNSYENNLLATSTKTRAYIKIQDGCNNFCSYCIVPYLRGRSRSRDLDSIIAEINQLDKDVKEIVLTGVDISSYGKDSGLGLKDLIKSIKSPARLRLGSLECGIIDEDFLQSIKDSNFCDHFHLSLQSGSNEVLKSMNRHYTAAEFLDKCQLIRKHFPFAGITTDVIAGFPTETKDHHQETKQFLLTAQFSDLHVFPYSPRQGTKAYGLKQLDKKVREQRAAELIEIKNTLKDNFITKNLGRVLDVYAEEREEGFVIGFTSNYIKLYTNIEPGQLKAQRLVKKHKEGVISTDE